MGACGSKQRKLKASKVTGKVPIIWVIGDPESGKGLQCANLVQKFGLQRVSSGPLLREYVTTFDDEKQEKKLNDMIDKEELVSTELVMKLVKAEVEKYMDTAKGFVVDGCPRGMDQATYFEEKIGPCSLILYYECPDKVLTERLKGRFSEEFIKKRLATFHQSCDPILDKYKAKVVRIDATKHSDIMFANSVKSVNQMLKLEGLEPASLTSIAPSPSVAV